MQWGLKHDFSVKPTFSLESWFHGNFWVWSRFMILFHNEKWECLDLLIISAFSHRLNDRILKAENAAFVDLTGESYPTLELETFATLNQQMMAGTLAKHLKYLTSNKKDKLHVLTAWTVVDLERPQGRELFRGALTQFKASNQLRIGKREGYGKQGGIFRKTSFWERKNECGLNVL